MKQIEVGRITVSREGVEIDSTTVLCLTEQEEALIGSSLEVLGFQKLDREALVKELKERHAAKPLFLERGF